MGDGHGDRNASVMHDDERFIRLGGRRQGSPRAPCRTEHDQNGWIWRPFSTIARSSGAKMTCSAPQAIDASIQTARRAASPHLPKPTNKRHFCMPPPPAGPPKGKCRHLGAAPYTSCARHGASAKTPRSVAIEVRSADPPPSRADALLRCLEMATHALIADGERPRPRHDLPHQLCD
jgi:hypothetical protein